MLFFSLHFLLLLLLVTTSHRMYLCTCVPGSISPISSLKCKDRRLSFTFGFPVWKYFLISCCRIQISNSGYVGNDPKCNLSLSPQVAATTLPPILFQNCVSLCVSHLTTEQKMLSEQHHTWCALPSALWSWHHLLNFLPLWLQKVFGREALKKTWCCKPYQDWKNHCQ